jgi:hypothetical protein
VWAGAFAVTCALAGVQWDISWHRSIGRDSFWIAPHILIYTCGVVAGIAAAWLILATTAGRRPDDATVKMWGFRGPLGAFLAAWGGTAMLASAPFDDWWHNAYGLDVKILSPPHSVLASGIFAVSLGALVLTVGERNRADGLTRAALDRLLAYVGGLVLTLTFTFVMEETSTSGMHSARFYWIVALAAAPMIATARASESRWAATQAAAVYSLFLCLLLWILPLFPAEPKLGPVYHPVTHFIPARFPFLLIAPAFMLDLFRPRTERLSPSLRAIVEGLLFLAVLVAVQWPFAIFLMSKWSRNRFFGTDYFDFYTPSTSYAMRHLFWRGERTRAQLFFGWSLAALVSIMVARLGGALGGLLARVKR